MDDMKKMRRQRMRELKDLEVYNEAEEVRVCFKLSFNCFPWHITNLQLDYSSPCPAFVWSMTNYYRSYKLLTVHIFFFFCLFFLLLSLLHLLTYIYMYIRVYIYYIHIYTCIHCATSPPPFKPPSPVYVYLFKNDWRSYYIFFMIVY
jgi:hypothetical protein